MKCEFYEKQTGICRATGKNCHLTASAKPAALFECSKQTVKSLIRSLNTVQLAGLAKKIKTTLAASA